MVYRFDDGRVSIDYRALLETMLQHKEYAKDAADTTLELIIKYLGVDYIMGYIADLMGDVV